MPLHSAACASRQVHRNLRDCCCPKVVAANITLPGYVGKDQLVVIVDNVMIDIDHYEVKSGSVFQMSVRASGAKGRATNRFPRRISENAGERRNW
jgi:hypothetical protein